MLVHIWFNKNTFNLLLLSFSGTDTRIQTMIVDSLTSFKWCRRYIKWRKSTIIIVAVGGNWREDSSLTKSLLFKIFKDLRKSPRHVLTLPRINGHWRTISPLTYLSDSGEFWSEVNWSNILEFSVYLYQ